MWLFPESIALLPDPTEVRNPGICFCGERVWGRISNSAACFLGNRAATVPVSVPFSVPSKICKKISGSSVLNNPKSCNKIGQIPGTCENFSILSYLPILAYRSI